MLDRPVAWADHDHKPATVDWVKALSVRSQLRMTGKHWHDIFRHWAN